MVVLFGVGWTSSLTSRVVFLTGVFFFGAVDLGVAGGEESCCGSFVADVAAARDLVALGAIVVTVDMVDKKRGRMTMRGRDRMMVILYCVLTDFMTPDCEFNE